MTAGSGLLPLPTLAALFLFGSVVVSYAMYVAFRWFKPSTELAATTTTKTEGLADGENSLAQLACCGFELGLLLLFTWLCENKPMFPHADKIHDFDFFYVIIASLMLVAVLFTVHKAPSDLGVLNREQSEEWKGMMQVVFLLYHQFALEETYPLIRLFISCYVFLTGFGNASFFYLKRDYSLIRVLAMLWRLLFACLVLAMTHDNPIILYYIVPLHTFYFLVSYVTMSLFEERVNYRKYGLQAKLALLGVGMYVVWEFPEVFNVVFSFLSNEPNPGAAVGAYGTRYEWQFRSGLDHYSSLFGMIFACSFPMMEARISSGIQTNRMVMFSVGAVMLSFAMYWMLVLFPQNKYVYNSQHAYVFVFPMVAYLFFRNAHPYLRRVHLGLFAHAGKYTLETYLLQHHIWLTSNAKTVLVLIPGFPKLNFLIVSAIYFLLSVKLFDLTVKLRFLIIPSNNRVGALKSLAFLAGAVGASFCIAFALIRLELVSVGINAIVVLVASAVWLLVAACHSTVRKMEKLWLVLSLVFAVLGMVVALVRGDEVNFAKQCNVNNGAWVNEVSGLCGESPGTHYAFCQARAWAWDISTQKQCGWKHASDLNDFDRVLVWSSNAKQLQVPLALARMEDAQFDGKFLPSSSKIEHSAGDAQLKLAADEKVLVVCEDEATHAKCAKLADEAAVVVLIKTKPIVTVGAVVDAFQVKSTALVEDRLAEGEYRKEVYDVIAQLVVNQARLEAKSRLPVGPPPAPPSGGGLAYNPMLGLLFLLVVFFGMVMGDGYLGLVAVFGRVFAAGEQAVTWESAVEKVHAQVPGLHTASPPTVKLHKTSEEIPDVEVGEDGALVDKHAT